MTVTPAAVRAYKGMTKIIRRIALAALLAIPAVAFASDRAKSDSCCPSNCCPGCPFCPR